MRRHWETWWPMYAALLIIGILFLLLVLTSGGIPICGLCGHEMYRQEVDYYIPTTVMVGKTPVQQMTPVYKNIPHLCPGQK